MSKLVTDRIVSRQVLEDVKRHFSTIELRNMKNKIDGLLIELAAHRDNNMSYGEQLLAREMLELGYYMANVEYKDEN